MLSESKLPSFERASIIFIFSALLCVAFISYFSTQNLTPKGNPIFLKDPRVKVTIEGAVEFPGVYMVEKGTLLKEVFDKAKPLPEALLSRYKMESPIKRTRKVNVKARKKRKKAK